MLDDLFDLLFCFIVKWGKIRKLGSSRLMSFFTGLLVKVVFLSIFFISHQTVLKFYFFSHYEIFQIVGAKLDF